MNPLRAIITAAVLAVLVLTACGATASHHAAVRKHPTANPVAAQIASAAAAECQQLSNIVSAINAATANDATVGALITTMDLQESAWNKQLEAASQIAQQRGVPTGSNQARILTVDIGMVAVDLAEIKVDADLGKYGLVKSAWNKTTADISAAQTACS